MKRTIAVIAAGISLLFSVRTIAEPPERASTVAQRELVNLTVYNGDMTLVHDRRRLSLNDGLNRIAWRDVSAQMDPTSALVEAVGTSSPVDVLEQNFNFDLLDPSRLLEKYVGKEVTVVHEARFAGERDTRERAKILSTNGGIVLQYRDRIETELRGHIVFPAAPKNFRDRPTLTLDLNSSHTGPETLDLSYITAGLSWHANYIGVVSPDERRMDLTGLVTLSNTSGVSYENARLQLVAGNVNNAQQLKTISAVSSRDGFSAQQPLQQENYFEYHLYTLPRPTTVMDKQTKQLSLLSAHGVPIRKTLELRGSPSYYRTAQTDLGDRLPVGVYITFDNRGGDLGVPLPGGVVRLYKNDSRNLSQFLGSDTIVHTPKNETVRLRVGDSFDITARKRQTDFRLAGGCSADSSYEIVVANAKDSTQNVLIVEPIPGDWQIVDRNLPYTKSSASTANWNVRVPAGGRATLSYTARVKWC